MTKTTVSVMTKTTTVGSNRRGRCGRPIPWDSELVDFIREELHWNDRYEVSEHAGGVKVLDTVTDTYLDVFQIRAVKQRMEWDRFDAPAPVEAVYRLSSLRIIGDNDDHRVLSTEGEADPNTAMEDHAKRRFRDNIHLQESVVVPLDRIRVASVKATPEQVEQYKRERCLPKDAQLVVMAFSLPFAEHHGTVYIYGEGFESLDAEQILTYFEESLFPGLRELGVSVEDAMPVFVFNHLP